MGRLVFAAVRTHPQIARNRPAGRRSFSPDKRRARIGASSDVSHFALRNRLARRPQIARIGLDLAKYVFEIHGVDAHGKTVLRKTLRRHAVSTFFANLPPCLVGLEASNGAHFWAQALSDLGHDVRLISPQFVTPYVKSNKNDRNDAEAICEAVGRPNMRFVPVKSPEQLAVQAVHRIRSRLVADRVRLVNQVRGLLGEHGIVVAKDIGNLRRALARIVGDNEDHALHDLVRSLMGSYGKN
jgi:transposase